MKIILFSRDFVYKINVTLPFMSHIIGVLETVHCKIKLTVKW